MTALRGNKSDGYRSDACECPSCGHKFGLRGSAASDRQGLYLALYAVPLNAGKPQPQIEGQRDPLSKYGIARPDSEWAPKRTTRLVDDPVPDFKDGGA